QHVPSPSLMIRLPPISTLFPYTTLFRSSELDSEGFSKEEVEINLKDRLKIAIDRLMTALETVEAICEPVQAPHTDLDFIHYFCGNTENPDELKANEYKRMALYKAIVEYIRAYANL